MTTLMVVPAVWHGPVGQVALPSQEKPIPCTTTSHFYMSPLPRKSRSLHLLLALTHNSRPSVVTHHHCTPCTSSSVIPLAPLSSILLGLLVLFSFQRSSAEDWQKLSLVSLAGGRGFLARKPVDLGILPRVSSHLAHHSWK